jgi:hypothetical protein
MVVVFTDGIGIRFGGHDLGDEFGEDYREYKPSTNLTRSR